MLSSSVFFIIRTTGPVCYRRHSILSISGKTHGIGLLCCLLFWESGLFLKILSHKKCSFQFWLPSQLTHVTYYCCFSSNYIHFRVDIVFIPTFDVFGQCWQHYNVHLETDGIWRKAACCFKCGSWDYNQCNLISLHTA